MSDLIPEINWTDLVKIVKDGKIGELKSCEVNFNCAYIFTVIIPHGDISAREDMKRPAEYLAVRANISFGKNPDEILREKEKADADLRISVS